MNEKHKQLGIPFGTANSRLKKQIMFSLVCKLGINKCFQCGEPMSVEDFSIEHKEPWLYKNPQLFWELDNISFSHLNCNVSAKKKRLLTHCKRGHELTEENTRKQKNTRVCKKCRLEDWHNGSKKRY